MESAPSAVSNGPVSTEFATGAVERLSLGIGDPRPGTGYGPEDVAIDAKVVSMEEWTMDASCACKRMGRGQKSLPTRMGGRWD